MASPLTKIGRRSRLGKVQSQDKHQEKKKKREGTKLRVNEGMFDSPAVPRAKKEEKRAPLNTRPQAKIKLTGA